jgi:GNAT superfamily N-acetyltransferase
VSTEAGQQLVIRDARPHDLPAIVEFNRCLALETEAKVLEPLVLSQGVISALADPDRIRYWIAEIGDPPHAVGQAAITREWSDWRNGWIWWLQSVYVTPPARRQGVFRQLYGRIRDEARADTQVIGIRLYVEDGNHRAQGTYQALGMTPGGYSVYQELWLERFGAD